MFVFVGATATAWESAWRPLLLRVKVAPPSVERRETEGRQGLAEELSALPPR